MQLFYWKGAVPNVGDDLNSWLWPRVLGPGVFDNSKDKRLLGIGSVFTPYHLLSAPAVNIVFGSGLRSPRNTASFQNYNVDIRFVRGPKSSRALGDVPYICDPAVIAPLYWEKRAPQVGRIGFVSYMRTPNEQSERISEATGVVHIPTTLSVDQFLEELNKCEYVVCEAMHGAILADAFRIPWIACRINSALYEGATSFFKWEDWLGSLGINAPIASAFPEILYRLPKKLRTRAVKLAGSRAIDLVNEQIKNGAWALSDANTLSSAQEHILHQAELLRTELKGN